MNDLNRSHVAAELFFDLLLSFSLILSFLCSCSILAEMITQLIQQ